MTGAASFTPGAGWIALAYREPPEGVDVVFDWWCYWPDSISWEIATDQPDCATHWCQLPKPPAYDRAALSRAKGQG